MCTEAFRPSLYLRSFEPCCRYVGPTLSRRLLFLSRTSCSAATKNRVASLLQCPLREYPSRIGRCIRVTLDGTHRSDRHSRFGTRSRDARKTRQLSRKKEPTRRLHCLDSIAPCARLQMRARGSSASSALEAGSLVRERHRCRQGVLSLGKEADFAVLESVLTERSAVGASQVALRDLQRVRMRHEHDGTAVVLLLHLQYALSKPTCDVLYALHPERRVLRRDQVARPDLLVIREHRAVEISKVTLADERCNFDAVCK
mmetsp:Transcript_26699/g.58588  ORF Transcript_26699/g.58588 Transcript_26699/m.58588 type:complete len:258 (-) Transcript_26699:542-1315(-)